MNQRSWRRPLPLHDEGLMNWIYPATLAFLPANNLIITSLIYLIEALQFHCYKVI